MLECDAKDCKTPRGASGRGFTSKGLKLHKVSKHAVPSITAPVRGSTVVYDVAEAAARIEQDRELPVDHGTPGDEVIMGAAFGTEPLWPADNTSAMEDVKKVLEMPSLEETIRQILGWQNGVPETWEQRKRQILQIIAATSTAPVGSSGEGEPGCIRIKARDRKLYVELDDKWQEMSLEQFINNVRFAINIS